MGLPVQSNQSCLIIDDSDVVRKVMRHAIEDLGFDVNEAADAKTAVSICKATMPDLIVLDWHLPGSQPFDVLVAIRSMPKGRQAKILYVVTNNDPDEIGRAITAGANDYMIKPFHGVSLKAKITAMTTRMRSEAEHEDIARVARARMMAATG
jgi:two-component system, chemotaxis family, chemotaxis protein CheY